MGSLDGSRPAEESRAEASVGGMGGPTTPRGANFGAWLDQHLARAAQSAGLAPAELTRLTDMLTSSPPTPQRSLQLFPQETCSSTNRITIEAPAATDSCVYGAPASAGSVHVGNHAGDYGETSALQYPEGLPSAEADAAAGVATGSTSGTETTGNDNWPSVRTHLVAARCDLGDCRSGEAGRAASMAEGLAAVTSGPLVAELSTMSPKTLSESSDSCSGGGINSKLSAADGNTHSSSAARCTPEASALGLAADSLTSHAQRGSQFQTPRPIHEPVPKRSGSQQPVPRTPREPDSFAVPIDVRSFFKIVAERSPHEGPAGEVQAVLQCIHADKLDVASFLLRQRCLVLRSGGNPWTFGRESNSDLLTRLVPDEGLRLRIARQHFELSWENQSMWLRNLPHNAFVRLFLNNELVSYQKVVVEHGARIDFRAGIDEIGPPFLSFLCLISNGQASPSQSDKRESWPTTPDMEVSGPVRATSRTPPDRIPVPLAASSPSQATASRSPSQAMPREAGSKQIFDALWPRASLALPIEKRAASIETIQGPPSPLIDSPLSLAVSPGAAGAQASAIRPSSLVGESGLSPPNTGARPPSWSYLEAGRPSNTECLEETAPQPWQAVTVSASERPALQNARRPFADQAPLVVGPSSAVGSSARAHEEEPSVQPLPAPKLGLASSPGVAESAQSSPAAGSFGRQSSSDTLEQDAAREPPFQTIHAAAEQARALKSIASSLATRSPSSLEGPKISEQSLPGASLQLARSDVSPATTAVTRSSAIVQPVPAIYQTRQAGSPSQDMPLWSSRGPSPSAWAPQAFGSPSCLAEATALSSTAEASAPAQQGHGAVAVVAMDGPPPAYMLLCMYARGTDVKALPTDERTIGLPAASDLSPSLSIGRQHQPRFFDSVLGGENPLLLAYISRSHLQITAIDGKPGLFEIKNLSINPVTVGSQTLQRNQTGALRAPMEIGFLASFADGPTLSSECFLRLSLFRLVPPKTPQPASGIAMPACGTEVRLAQSPAVPPSFSERLGWALQKDQTPEVLSPGSAAAPGQIPRLLLPGSGAGLAREAIRNQEEAISSLQLHASAVETERGPFPEESAHCRLLLPGSGGGAQRTSAIFSPIGPFQEDAAHCRLLLPGSAGGAQRAAGTISDEPGPEPEAQVFQTWQPQSSLTGPSAMLPAITSQDQSSLQAAPHVPTVAAPHNAMWLELGGTALRDGLPAELCRVCCGGISPGHANVSADECASVVVGRAHQPQLHAEALDENAAQWVSREHFRVEYFAHEYSLQPLGTNVIWLEREGQRISLIRGQEGIVLEAGDLIRLYTGSADGTPDGQGASGTLHWRCLLAPPPFAQRTDAPSSDGLVYSFGSASLSSGMQVSDQYAMPTSLANLGDPRLASVAQLAPTPRSMPPASLVNLGNPRLLPSGELKA